MAREPTLQDLLGFMEDEERQYYDAPKRTEGERKEMIARLQTEWQSIPDPSAEDLKPPYMHRTGWAAYEAGNKEVIPFYTRQWKRQRRVKTIRAEQPTKEEPPKHGLRLRQAAIAKLESDRSNAEAVAEIGPESKSGSIKPQELSLSTVDTLQQPQTISLEVADDISSAMREEVGETSSVKRTTETAASNSHKGAVLAFAVSSTIGTAALNVLNQKYGASIPDWVILLAGYVAAGFWLYWAWQTSFVRHRRLSLLYTKHRMLTVFVIVGALIGGLAGMGLWFVNRNEQRLKTTAATQASPNTQPQQDGAATLPSTPNADDVRLARIEFGTNSAKPLRSVRIDVLLKQPFSAAQLGHFRVLIDFGKTNDVIPNVWIGLRDNYARSYGDGKNELIFGVVGFVRGITPEIRGTQHEVRAQFVTDHIQMDFDLDKTPYRTIDDLNHKIVHVYVTESLIDKIQALTLSGNNYVLIETDAREFRSDIPPKIGYDTFPWPFPLTAAELSQPWKYIVLGKPNAPIPREGATMFDFDRKIPRKSL